MRIVSLLPSATEILFALGLGDQVVGVTFECNHPIDALTKRIVSTSALPEGLSPAEIDAVVKERMAAGEDLYRLDEDALSSIDPDLIVTQNLCAVCAVDVDDVDGALYHLGCSAQVVTLDPMTIDDVIESIGIVGAATGTEEAADSLVTSLRSRLKAVAETVGPAVEAGDRPNVVLIEWIDPAFTGGHWVPDMITAAGGEPILGFPGSHSEGMEWDRISSSGADIVIVAPCGFDTNGCAEQAEALIDRGVLPPAAEVWAVNADALVVRPGPRIVDGVETFATMFHPELMGDGHGAMPDPSAARRLL